VPDGADSRPPRQQSGAQVSAENGVTRGAFCQYKPLGTSLRPIGMRPPSPSAISRYTVHGTSFLKHFSLLVVLRDAGSARVLSPLEKGLQRGRYVTITPPGPPFPCASLLLRIRDRHYIHLSSHMGGFAAGIVISVGRAQTRQGSASSTFFIGPDGQRLFWKRTASQSNPNMQIRPVQDERAVLN
jgi:hypothetical protein